MFMCEVKELNRLVEEPDKREVLGSFESGDELCLGHEKAPVIVYNFMFA